VSESTNYSPKLLIKSIVESDDMTRRNLSNQVNRNIFIEQTKYCKGVNKGKTKSEKYAIGGSVWVNSKLVPPNGPKKLWERYLGLFEIVELQGEHALKLRTLPELNKFLLLHKIYIKRFYDPGNLNTSIF
jgi:hypothetical protein